MKNLFLFVLCFTSFSTPSYAVDLEENCEEQFDDFAEILEVTAAKTTVNPLFNFAWNENAEEFTLSGTIEFPKGVTVSDAFINSFLSEQAVKSVTHSAAGVKTLGQSFNGSKEPKDLPEVGKVVPFSVTAEKCKSIFCKSGKMESKCKFTEKTANKATMDCTGVPNSNMKSHSTKITCVGGATTKCNFELKGQPDSRKYALGGAAESLYNFYGLSYRAVGNKFSEDGFAKTGGPGEIDKFYKAMIGDSGKKSYSAK
jgi:hypothetical protein